MSTLQARTSRCFSEVGDSLCCGWIWMLMEGYCWSTWSLLVPICQRAFSVSNALMPRVRWVRKRASERGSCKLSQNWLLGCLTDLHPSGKGAWEHTKACFSLCRSWGRFHRMGNLQSWKILMTQTQLICKAKGGKNNLTCLQIGVIFPGMFSSAYKSFWILVRKMY